MPDKQYMSLVHAMRVAFEKAAQRLLFYFNNVERLKIESKEGSDFVSEADRESDAIIRVALSMSFPEFGFLTEEGPKNEPQNSSRFIIDSLDGTTNFLHHLKFWCITGAAEIDGELVAAVTLAPLLGECYWAVKGGGAYLDKEGGPKLLKVSRQTDLERALVVVGLPFKGHPKPGALAQTVSAGKEVAGTESLRCVALEGAYVAQGS